MNREKFNNYLKNPEKLDQGSVSDITDLLAEFPYFQTAHLLLLKNLHNIESIKLDNQLKVSSAFVGDRRILFHLLHQRSMEASVPDEEVLKAEAADKAAKEEIPDASPAGTPEKPVVEAEKAIKEDKKVAPPAEKPVTKTAAPSTAPSVEKSAKPVVPAEGEHSRDVLTEQVLKRVEEIKKREGKTGIQAEPSKKPKPAKPGEESVADRILRELAEARKSRGAKLTPREETGEKNQKDAANDSSLLQIDDNAGEDIPTIETGPEDQPPAGSADLLEIDDTPSPEEEKNKKTPKKKTPEKKTPDLNAGSLDEAHYHTFGQWLTFFDESDQPGEEKKNGEESPEEALINQFLTNNPDLERPADDFNLENVDISTDSSLENEGYFSDTLARIYIKQGYYSKAIFAYEKLSLKFPEKSGYFATQIEKIEAIIESKSG